MSLLDSSQFIRIKPKTFLFLSSWKRKLWNGAVYLFLRSPAPSPLFVHKRFVDSLIAIVMVILSGSTGSGAEWVPGWRVPTACTRSPTPPVFHPPSHCILQIYSQTDGSYMGSPEMSPLYSIVNALTQTAAAIILILASPPLLRSCIQLSFLPSSCLLSSPGSISFLPFLFHILSSFCLTHTHVAHWSQALSKHLRSPLFFAFSYHAPSFFPCCLNCTKWQPLVSNPNPVLESMQGGRRTAWRAEYINITVSQNHSLCLECQPIIWHQSTSRTVRPCPLLPPTPLCTPLSLPSYGCGTDAVSAEIYMQHANEMSYERGKGEWARRGAT